MLKEIRIKNFQSHSSLTLELDEGVNTIIGPTDRGKSAIIRAIKLTALNQPAGTAFIRDGADKTKVKIKTEDSQVTRIRGKTTNSYIVNGKKLEAFGQSVPPTVTEALNISDINFQQQHDSPFWFSETAGEVSRKLNEIVHLEVIDSTLSNLDSAKRQTTTEIKVHQRAVKEAADKKKSLAYVKDMNAGLVMLEKRQSANINLRQTCDILGEIIERHIIVASAQKNAADAASEGLNWLKKAGAWSDLSERAEKLLDLIEIIEEKQTIAQNRPESIKHLEKQAEAIRSLRQKIANFEDLLINLEATMEMHRISVEQHKSLSIQFKKEVGKTCPLCGSKIK
jgi:predicted ATP-dependent endonuclease of OLD family